MFTRDFAQINPVNNVKRHLSNLKSTSILSTNYDQGSTWYHSLSFLGVFAQLRKTNISLVMTVRPHQTTPLPLEGFSCILLFEDFSKICYES